MKPVVSVIIPVYNVRSYLERCLKSVSAQTLRDIEVIVVDDGSTDGSGEICDGFAAADRRFRVLHTENRGVSEARNSGLYEAAGDYIAFVDSDDYVHERFLETLLAAARELSCPISMCNYAVTRGDEATEPCFPEPEVKSADELLADLYSKGEILITVLWNKLFRASLFEGERFPKGKINEDGAVVYRLLHAATRIAFADCALYYYYMSEDSIMRNRFRERNYDYFRALDRRLEDFKAWGMDELVWLTERRYCFKILDYLNVFELSEGDRRKLEMMYEERERILFENPRSGIKTKLQFTLFRAFPALYKFARARRHMG